MKTRFLLLSVLMFVTAKIDAGIPIFYSYGDDMVKVVELPDRDEFQLLARDGNAYHADLGILHKQFSLFWIPLVNFGEEQYVFYTDKKIMGQDYTYVSLSPSDIEYLQSEIGGIPSSPELPFWDAWGGKLLVVIAKLD